MEKANKYSQIVSTTYKFSKHDILLALKAYFHVKEGIRESFNIYDDEEGNFHADLMELYEDEK